MKPLSLTVVNLRQMAVSGESLRQGVGKQLIEFAEKNAKEYGFTNIETAARRAAVAFYEKVGYKKSGDEFLEIGIPHVVMRKNNVSYRSGG